MGWASCIYLHARTLGEGAGLHGAWHSRVLVLTAPATQLQPPEVNGPEERTPGLG